MNIAGGIMGIGAMVLLVCIFIQIGAYSQRGSHAKLGKILWIIGAPMVFVPYTLLMTNTTFVYDLPRTASNSALIGLRTAFIVPTVGLLIVSGLLSFRPAESREE